MALIFIKESVYTVLWKILLVFGHKLLLLLVHQMKPPNMNTWKKDPEIKEQRKLSNHCNGSISRIGTKA